MRKASKGAIGAGIWFQFPCELLALLSWVSQPDGQIWGQVVSVLVCKGKNTPKALKAVRPCLSAASGPSTLSAGWAVLGKGENSAKLPKSQP